jgi:CRP-like cAMP-binding protein
MSLFDRQPRSANVVAVSETQLLALDRDAFHKHLLANPSTALAILAEMSRRLRHADEVIGNLALLDVYARVARVIREMALKQGEQVEGGILIRERPTQQEIAGLVGTSRETVSRALSEFTRRGLLEVEGKQVLVRWAFLRELHEAA